MRGWIAPERRDDFGGNGRWPPLQGRQGVEDAGILRGPAGGAEFFIADAFAGGGGAGCGGGQGVGADGLGEVGAAGGVVVDGVEDAGETAGADVAEGAGGVVAVDEVDEGFGGAKSTEVAGTGGVNKAGAAGSVDAAEADNGAAGLEGELFGGHENVAGGSSAHQGDFVDGGAVILRVDGGAAGEDGELRGENFDEVAQCIVINNAVSGGVASFFAAQAMDEDIGVDAAGEAGAEFLAVGGVGDDDGIGFAGEAAGRLLRRDEGGDGASGLVKKIRAPFTGVATAGEEDARS